MRPNLDYLGRGNSATLQSREADTSTDEVQQFAELDYEGVDLVHDLTVLEADVEMALVEVEVEEMVSQKAAGVLNELSVDLENSKLDGGLTPTEASLVLRQLDVIGMADNALPTLQSFGGTKSRLATTVTLQGTITDKIKEVYEWIKKQILKFYDMVTAFMSKFLATGGRITARAAKISKRAAKMGALKDDAEKIKIPAGFVMHGVESAADLVSGTVRTATYIDETIPEEVTAGTEVVKGITAIDGFTTLGDLSAVIIDYSTRFGTNVRAGTSTVHSVDTLGAARTLTGKCLNATISLEGIASQAQYAASLTELRRAKKLPHRGKNGQMQTSGPVDDATHEASKKARSDSAITALLKAYGAFKVNFSVPTTGGPAPTGKDKDITALTSSEVISICNAIAKTSASYEKIRKDSIEQGRDANKAIKSLGKIKGGDEEGDIPVTDLAHTVSSCGSLALGLGKPWLTAAISCSKDLATALDLCDRSISKYKTV